LPVSVLEYTRGKNTVECKWTANDQERLVIGLRQLGKKWLAVTYLDSTGISSVALPTNV
jgi:hypothetical protein